MQILNCLPLSDFFFQIENLVLWQFCPLFCSFQAACSHFVISLVHQCPQDLAAYTGKYDYRNHQQLFFTQHELNYQKLGQLVQLVERFVTNHEIWGLWVQYLARQHTLFFDWSWNAFCSHSPFTSDLSRSAVSYWHKYVPLVLVNQLTQDK